jgi:putative heme-binding domain-containing protein
MQLAADTGESAGLRAEAVMGLASENDEQRGLLWKLATNADERNEAIRREALRTLRGATLDERQRELIAKLSSGDDAEAALARRIVEPQSVDSRLSDPRPDKTDVDAWMKVLEGPADRAAGERVFVHAKSVGCYRCHRHDGRGAEVGPDLTMIGRSSVRRRIVESILQPAKDIAPLFFAWQIETEDGQNYVGMLVDEQVNGDQTYVDAQGKRTTFKQGEIAVRRSVRTSVMPDSVIEGLTTQELRDLVAFLTADATP